MNFDKIIAVRTGKTVYKDGGRAVKVFDGDYSKSDITKRLIRRAPKRQGLMCRALSRLTGKTADGL